MVQMEQADAFTKEPQMAEHAVQNATRFICPLECMPMLLIANIILKSWMNREVHVQFCEEQGVKVPLLTRLHAVYFPPFVKCQFTVALSLVIHYSHRIRINIEIEMCH